MKHQHTVAQSLLGDGAYAFSKVFNPRKPQGAYA